MVKFSQYLLLLVKIQPKIQRSRILSAMATSVIQAGPQYRSRHNPQFSVVVWLLLLTQLQGTTGSLVATATLFGDLSAWILKYPVKSYVRDRSVQGKPPFLGHSIHCEE